jgi:hypothetical protein
VDQEAIEVLPVIVAVAYEYLVLGAPNSFLCRCIRGEKIDEKLAQLSAEMLFERVRVAVGDVEVT